jgi:hypothetical protein
MEESKGETLERGVDRIGKVMEELKKTNKEGLVNALWEVNRELTGYDAADFQTREKLGGVVDRIIININRYGYGGESVYLGDGSSRLFVGREEEQVDVRLLERHSTVKVIESWKRLREVHRLAEENGGE